jgi:hypothetical protein
MYDRQSRRQRQGVDASRVGVRERVKADIKCFCTSLERLDRGCDILAKPHFRPYGIETERVGCRQDCVQFQVNLWIRGIEQDR